jgi:hypothetical protein
MFGGLFNKAIVTIDKPTSAITEDSLPALKRNMI